MKESLVSLIGYSLDIFCIHIFASFQEVHQELSKQYKHDTQHQSTSVSTQEGRGSDGGGEANASRGMGMEKPSRGLPVLQDILQNFGIIHANRCEWGWRWRGARRRRWFVNDMLLQTFSFIFVCYFAWFLDTFYNKTLWDWFFECDLRFFSWFIISGGFNIILCVCLVEWNSSVNDMLLHTFLFIFLCVSIDVCLSFCLVADQVL